MNVLNGLLTKKVLKKSKNHTNTKINDKEISDYESNPTLREIELFSASFEKNSKIISLEGEIINYEKVKSELISKDYTFTTDTELEVILHAYEEYGEDCAKLFEGIFSFIIWDSILKDLIVVRDRVGVKPLYYSNEKNKLLFGSRLKNVMQNKEIKEDINFEAVESFLRFYYIPQPMTIFQNVHQIMPGHYLKYSFENKSLKIKKYWDVNPVIEELNDSYESLKIKLRKKLNSVINDKTSNKTKVGAFLSGGIDSSIVVGLLAEQSESPINTFTIGYKDNKQYDESSLAKTVSRLHDTNHSELFIDFQDLEDVIEKIILSMEEPFADSSAIPTYYVSRLTKNYADLALSGDGGDELFAGYNKYTSVYYQQLYSKIPSVIRKRIIEASLAMIPSDNRNLVTSFATKANKFIKSSDDDIFQMHVKLMEAYQEDQIDLLVKNKSIKTFDVNGQLLDYFNYLETEESVNRMMYTDLKFALPNDMLVKTDRMSAINDLEIRSPFLDYKVIELAYKIPLKYKMRGTKRKIILKEAFSDLLPKEILTAKKRGFGIPLAEWFKEELNELLKDSLSKEKVENANLVNFAIVQSIIEEHMENKKNHANLLWSLVVLHKWHENFTKSMAEVKA